MIQIVSILCLIPFTLNARHQNSVTSPPIAVFHEVWQLVRDNFYDPTFNDVDWNAARERYEPLFEHSESPEAASVIIDRMLAELGAPHTHFYTNLDREYYELLDVFAPGLPEEQMRHLFPNGEISYPGIGILTRDIDGMTFIKGVLHGSPADEAGLEVGSRIISIGAKPYHPIKPFVGNVGREIPVEVQFDSDPNSRRTVGVVPQNIVPHEQFYNAMKQSMAMKMRNGKAIGYVRVWSYAGERYHELLRHEIAHGLFKDADALILDLRDGWGGANPDYLNLFNRDAPAITWILRNGEQTTVDYQWRKPVAMLVNEGTRSGKEILAWGFKKYGIGMVIGSRTKGAVTGGRLFLLKDGSALYLAVRGSRIDGEVLEGEGVAPDIEVPFRLEYCDGYDPQLEKALDLLSGAGA